MLTRIQSDAFKRNGEIIKPIPFESGLNIVLGDDSAANAIGKSSFMMIIDFVFGGKSYIDKNYLPDIKENIGNHAINFTFKFDKEYHFSRETDVYSKIYICDENFVRTDIVWDINKFNNFLEKQYDMQNENMSFRDFVNNFLRIYRKDNYNSNFPLLAYTKDTFEKGIDRLLIMFNKYENLKGLKQIHKEKQTISSVYNNAIEHSFISAAKDKATYDKNVKEIQILLLQKNNLVSLNKKGVQNIKGEDAPMLAQYKKDLGKLRYQKSCLIRDKQRVQENSLTSYDSNLNKLQEFFPECQFRKMDDIENFHKSIVNILKKDEKKYIKDIESKIYIIDLQIKEIEKLMDEYKLSETVPKKVLLSYAQIESKLKMLQKANKAFLNKNKLSDEKKTASKNIETEIDLIKSGINDLINKKMEGISSDISDNYSPKFNLENSKKYSFITPKDTSTGNSEKSMVIFDLALLNLTKLPILIHDSVFLKQIEDPSIETLLNEYQKQTKQVFISLDKKNSYTASSIKTIGNNVVLHLTKENPLFGVTWNSKIKDDK